MCVSSNSTKPQWYTWLLSLKSSCWKHQWDQAQLSKVGPTKQNVILYISFIPGHDNSVMLIWMYASKSIPSWILFFKMTVWITTWWRVGTCLHVRVSGHAGQSLGRRFHGFFKVGVQGVKAVPLSLPCLTLSLFTFFSLCWDSGH